MLAADRDLLQAETRQRESEICIREIWHIKEELSGLATQAALLAGFSYQGLNLEAPGQWFMADSGDFELLDATAGGQDHYGGTIMMLFVIFNSGSMMLNLLAVFAATFLAMFGPTAALRGDPKHLHPLLKEIRKKRKLAIRLFLGGIYSFALAAIFMTFYYWPTTPACVVTIIVVGGYAYMVKIFFSMKRAFLVPDLMPRSVSFQLPSETRIRSLVGSRGCSMIQYAHAYCMRPRAVDTLISQAYCMPPRAVDTLISQACSCVRMVAFAPP